MLETDLRWDRARGGDPLELFLELFDLERPLGVSKAVCVTGRREVSVVESVPRDEDTIQSRSTRAPSQVEKGWLENWFLTNISVQKNK
jgi:hypothetical protein